MGSPGLSPFLMRTDLDKSIEKYSKISICDSCL